MRILLFSFMVFIFLGCGGKSEEELLKQAKDLSGNKKYVEAVRVYESILSEFPDSKSNEKVLYDLGVIYQSKAITSNSENVNLTNAIKYYGQLYKSFPSSANAPGALFMSAFIYANELKNLDSAKVRYTEFLNKYPNHELAESAKYELDNLGLTPEQVLEKINNSK